MNKKMILLGVAALAGCFVLASFDKKTLAQQKEEINAAVTAKLDALRSEKEAACTETVNAEASKRFDTWKAEEAAKAPVVGGKKKAPIKKSGTTGPKVEPLPQQPAPAPTNPKDTKMQGGTNTSQKDAKMQGQPTTTDKKNKKMGGGK